MKKALKIVSTKEPFDFKIKGVNIFSKNELELYKDRIPTLNKSWWLRSAADNNHVFAALASGHGNMSKYLVQFETVAVRPALYIEVDNSMDFQIGDKIEFYDKEWTVVDSNENTLYILCDESIGQHRFDEETTYWEDSELKRWLECYFGVTPI